MLTPKQAFAEESVAQVTVGFPGVPLSAQIPIRGSWFGWLGRPFRRTPPEQLVQVVMWSSSVVTANEDDSGGVDVYLGLVNLTERNVRVDALHLELFYISGYATKVAQPLFSPPKDPIVPLSGAEVMFTISIGPAPIRDLLQRIQKAQNAVSSPWLELTVGGKLDLHIDGSLGALQRAQTIRLPFERKVKNPQLQLSCPSARQGS